MWRSTSASHVPNCGMVLLELPTATSSMPGSTMRIALAVSAARRPYSVAVFCPICQGPSSSFPRHQRRTACGSLAPWLRRRSDQYVPSGWLQYSSRSMASCTPRVPRLTAIMGSTSASLDHDMNSLRPMAFGSIPRHARSRRTGRSSTGPTPSSHR